MKLDGKVAVVTGAGRGIGRGIATRLAANGAKVVVASRTRATVDEVVDSIVARGGTAVGATLDVASRDEFVAVIAKTVDQFGRLDALVNNAQSFGRPGSAAASMTPRPFVEFDENEWDHMYRTGLKGTVYGMLAVYPHMKAQGRGRIINMYSPASDRASAGMAGYHAAKAAVLSITRTTAREWGPDGITVNCISPAIENDAVRAALDSAGNEEARETVRQAMVASIPLGRMGDAERDAGAVAAFLTSDDAAFVTGAVLRVDGGLAL